MRYVVDVHHAAFSSFRADSIEEYAGVLRHLDVELRQLGRGPFLGRTDSLELGGIRLIRRSSSAPYLSQGHFRDSAMLVFPCMGAELSVNGARIGAERQVGAAGPVEVLNVFPAGTELLLVEIALAHLPRYLDASACDRFRASLGRAGYFDCNPLRRARISARLHRIFRQLAGAAHPLSAHTCRRAGRLVMRLLQDYLDTHQADTGLPVSRRSAARERTLQRAMLHLLEEPDSSLEQLATAAFASKRSLQYQFRELLGQNVHGFAKLLRLNLLRRDLVAADTASSLEQLTLRHGFSNSSRAGREYLALFGETMKDTRERWRGTLPCNASTCVYQASVPRLEQASEQRIAQQGRPQQALGKEEHKGILQQPLAPGQLPCKQACMAKKAGSELLHGKVLP